MVVYTVAVALSMICAAYAANVREIKQLRGTYVTLCICAYLPMTLVSALRYEVGTDWPIYRDYFYSIGMGETQFNEPLFNLLNRVIYFFTEDAWWLFAVCSVITLYFTFRAFLEQSINPAFSILIYAVCGYYFNAQNQLRQAMAMSIFLYALKYVKSREWKKYFIWIAIASMIHLSAILYFAVYFLYCVKVNVKRIIILYAVIAISFPVLSKAIVFVISKTRYAWYFSSMFNLSNFYLLGFVVYLFYFVLILFYYSYGAKHAKERARLTGEVETEDLEYNLLVHMYFMVSLTTVFSAVVPQMTRITMLFSVVKPLLIPHLIIREHDRNRRIVLYMILVLGFGAKLFYDVFLNGWHAALPYQSIFSV